MTPYPTNRSSSPPRRRPVRRTAGIALLAAATVLAGTASAIAGPSRTSSTTTASAGSSELSETTRLADRRSLVVGDRAYAMGDETGLYPASGWHIRGEMGGFWSQPIKLLDGIWFGLDGNWLGKDVAAAKYTSGHGYSRIDYSGSVDVRRTDFVPDGVRATLVGLTLSSSTAKTVKLDVDAHSELMQSYPWGWTTPSAADANLPDTGDFTGSALRFREQGTPTYPNAAAHDYAAFVGSSLRPSDHQLGPDHRGPQSPAVICPADGTTPARCDDSLVGKGTGGRLTYDVPLAAGQSKTIWFAVAGSDQGSGAAEREFGKALSNPEKLLRAKTSARQQIDAQSAVDLPGDRLLQQSVEWSKQNLADSVQEARNLRIRDVNEGKDYPAPVGQQHYVYEYQGPESFRDQVAPARTFGFVHEFTRLAAAGLAAGGRLDNCVLIGEDGVINGELRFPDEFVRHKILDVMGDFSLLGRPLRGRIVARATGHRHNVAMVRELLAAA